MKPLKMMLLGIGLLLFSIFCRIMGIGYVYSQIFIHYLPLAAAVAGLILLLAGFFLEDDA